MNIVKVEWVDSYGVTQDWTETKDAKDIKHVCTSVGFLLVDGVQSLTLSQNISPKNEKIGAEEMSCGNISIPVRSIIRIVDLLEDPGHAIEV